MDDIRPFFAVLHSLSLNISTNLRSCEASVFVQSCQNDNLEPCTHCPKGLPLLQQLTECSNCLAQRNYCHWANNTGVIIQRIPRYNDNTFCQTASKDRFTNGTKSTSCYYRFITSMPVTVCDNMGLLFKQAIKNNYDLTTPYIMLCIIMLWRNRRLTTLE